MVRPLNPSGVLDPIEAAAARARAAAGLRSDGPLIDVLAALRRLGLLVVERDLGDPGPDGIYATEERGGIVILNTRKPADRVRRTAAHLLAHHVFGDQPHLDRDVDAALDDPFHVRANAFSARFLRHNGPTMEPIPAE